MALVQALASLRMADKTTEIGSLDQPLIYDNTVATLASLATWIQGLAVQVDTVSDGVINKLRLSLLIPLPSGLKTTPGANLLEETGLITFNVASTPNKYSVDVPAMSAQEFTGSNLILSGTPSVSGLVSYLTAPSGSIQGTDRYGNALLTVSRARMTFRKHRRALSRA